MRPPTSTPSLSPAPKCPLIPLLELLLLKQHVLLHLKVMKGEKAQHKHAQVKCPLIPLLELLLLKQHVLLHLKETKGEKA